MTAHQTPEAPSVRAGRFTPPKSTVSVTKMASPTTLETAVRGPSRCPKTRLRDPI